MQNTPDLLCFSHLRWGFVYQRPQHLLSRFARDRRVFFFEEPVFDSESPRLERRQCAESGVHIVTPHLPKGLSVDEQETALGKLASELADQSAPRDYAIWYYTPMALPFTRHLNPVAVAYDCMDELSGFAGAPPRLRQLELELFQHADVVFTGGQTLYESKRQQHHNVHAFPSSVDVPHFAQARQKYPEPADQASIPHPRIGYCGVIDERMDIELVGEVAKAHPEWHFVMIGPVVKIDPEKLPKPGNIHYLGQKSYQELPVYMSTWDAAILPFAHNDATRFISPTKTPEYLAAGLPVVSTSIRDVVRPYGNLGLSRIADGPEEFGRALEKALAEDSGNAELRAKVDEFLSALSWDRTQGMMAELLKESAGKRNNGGSTSNSMHQERTGACSTI